MPERDDMNSDEERLDSDNEELVAQELQNMEESNENQLQTAMTGSQGSMQSRRSTKSNDSGKSARSGQSQQQKQSSRISVRSNASSSGNSTPVQRKERPKATFVFPLEKKFECPSCDEVLHYPVAFQECGHHVCSPCFENEIKRNDHRRCPTDQGKIDVNAAEVNMELQEEIWSLEAKCNNHEWGCKWEGEYRQVQEHGENCEHTEVLCVNDCGAKFQRRFMQKHLDKDCPRQIIACAHCDDRHLREDRKEHLEDCPKMPLACPNKCDKTLTIPRDELDKHIEEVCPKTKIPCEYEALSCDHRATREKIPKHYKSEIINHLKLVYDLVVKNGERLDAHDKMFAENAEHMQNLDNRVGDLERIAHNALIWRIEDYSRKLKEAKAGNYETLFSPTFTTSKHGYRLCASICLNGDGKGKGTHSSVFVSVLKGAFDSLLKWPFDYRVTFFLLDQAEVASERKHLKFSIKPNPCKENEPFLGRPRMEKNASFGGAKFAKHDDMETRKYIKDDAIFLKVVVDCDAHTEP